MKTEVVKKPVKNKRMEKLYKTSRTPREKGNQFEDEKLADIASVPSKFHLDGGQTEVKRRNRLNRMEVDQVEKKHNFP